MGFFWVVKLPRLHDAQLWRVFSFKYCSMALCMILQDSSSLVSVYFCDLGIELYTQDLVKFLQHCLFQDIFFKMVGLEVDQLRRMFIHSLFCGMGWKTTYVYSQRQNWGLILLRLKNYREPGNMYLPEMAMNLLFCSFHLMFMLCWTRYHTILSRCWRKNAKIFIKLDAECVGNFL